MILHSKNCISFQFSVSKNKSYPHHSLLPFLEFSRIPRGEEGSWIAYMTILKATMKMVPADISREKRSILFPNLTIFFCQKSSMQGDWQRNSFSN